MKTIEVTYRYEGCGCHSRPQPPNSEAARLRLDDGNRAFAALFDGFTKQDGVAQQVVPVDLRDLGLLPGNEGAPKQRPFAAILGCSDARVPIELIFNEGPNDLFVIRVAGNGLGSEVAGQPEVCYRESEQQSATDRRDGTQWVRSRSGSSRCVP